MPPGGWWEGATLPEKGCERTAPFPEAPVSPRRRAARPPGELMVSYRRSSEPTVVAGFAQAPKPAAAHLPLVTNDA